MTKAVCRLFGGAHYGLGHMMRLHRYIETNGIDAPLFIVNHDPQLIALLNRYGYAFRTADQANDLKVLLESEHSILDACSWFIDVKTDISDELSIIRQLNGKHITLFDNTSPARLLADVNIYPTPLYCEDDLDWRGYKGKRFGGWEYTILGPSFDAEKARRTPWNRRQTIVISFGASDPNQLTLMAMKGCANIPLDTPIQVVIGPAFTHATAIHSLNSTLENRFEVIEGCMDLAPVFSTARYVITAVGVSLFEATYLDAHCVVISNYESDKKDEKKLRLWDTVTVLGDYTGLDTSTLQRYIEGLAK